MKSGYSYYKSKKIQSILLPVIFCSIAFWGLLFFVFADGGDVDDISVLAAFLYSIMVCGGYYYYLKKVDLDDGFAILWKALLFLLVIIFVGFLLCGISYAMNFVELGDADVFSAVLILCILPIMLLVIPVNLTRKRIIPAISLLQQVWEKSWYLENDVQGAEKGDAWIFYKNGQLIITSPYRDGQEKSLTYSWQYDPRMRSIILYSGSKTRVLMNIEVKNNGSGIQSLSFTTNHPNSLHQFSSVMPEG